MGDANDVRTIKVCLLLSLFCCLSKNMFSLLTSWKLPSLQLSRKKCFPLLTILKESIQVFKYTRTEDIKRKWWQWPWCSRIGWWTYCFVFHRKINYSLCVTLVYFSPPFSTCSWSMILKHCELRLKWKGRLTWVDINISKRRRNWKSSERNNILSKHRAVNFIVIQFITLQLFISADNYNSQA